MKLKCLKCGNIGNNKGDFFFETRIVVFIIRANGHREGKLDGRITVPEKDVLTRYTCGSCLSSEVIDTEHPENPKKQE